VSLFKNRGFNHEKAQKYEILHSERWVNENYDTLYDDLGKAKRTGTLWPGPGGLFVKEFFDGSFSKWQEFAEYIMGKTCIEIGSGPLPALCVWYWAGDKIVIDPLINEYKRLTTKNGRQSWFSDDMTLYPSCAEHYVSAFAGIADGVIVCRNALDHCEKPALILDNISKYAAPGCQLLLWSDLWHLDGHDEGHTNITKDRARFEQDIIVRGFSIIDRYEDTARKTINYGCRAVKRSPGE